MQTAPRILSSFPFTKLCHCYAVSCKATHENVTFCHLTPLPPLEAVSCNHSYTPTNAVIYYQWRTEGGLGVQPPLPPRNSEGPPKSCQTQPDCEKCLKNAEFRAPTPHDVRKKDSKILKLLRFAVVLH